MRRERELKTVLALAAVVGAAVCFLFPYMQSNTPGPPAYDLYQYYYPNIRYAIQALRDGSSGLLWNAFQSCGEPFFGISFTGLLYPANVLYLLLDPDRALIGVFLFNLIAGGVFSFLLCRELGASVTAATCGALTFELGNAMVSLTSWGPQMTGPYAWMPAAMWCCERILRHPSVGRGIALGGVLAVSLLPGFPQAVFFTYQLIAWRLLWELVVRRAARPRALLVVVFGLILGPLLAAVQLVPALELARLSVRGGELSIREIAGGSLTWSAFRQALAFRQQVFNPVLLLPMLLAGFALVGGGTKRLAGFYALAGLLYFILSFGPNTPLFGWYTHLPLTALFRMPGRFFWISSFCLAVVVAFGVDAVLARERPPRAVSRYGGLAAAAVVLVGLHLLIPRGLRWEEWMLAGIVFGAGVAARLAPRARPLVAGIVVAALGFNLLAFPSAALSKSGLASWQTRFLPVSRILPDSQLLFSREAAFAALKALMSPQDRAYLVHQHANFAVQPKSAALFRLPSIQDYEPQPTQRYAEYFTLLRTGQMMRNLNDVYLPLQGLMPRGFNRRLFDLAAARYLLVDPKVDATEIMKPPLRLVSTVDGLRLYENAQALPRAFYVPRLEVVPNPRDLLERLAHGGDDLRQVALVEDGPADGFTGAAADLEPVAVDILVDEPERVTLRVQAPARGFVFLADQYYPGWTVAVNGDRRPIMRANYLFRVVEVPTGDSTVEFRYQPLSVWIGALVSMLTLATVTVMYIRVNPKSLT